MDEYETLWRERAAEHGFTDVDWYVYLKGVASVSRYPSEAAAEAALLQSWGDWRPGCGRGLSCADWAPWLGAVGRSGHLSRVEAMLEDEYDDD